MPIGRQAGHRDADAGLADARDEVKRVVALADGPGEQAHRFGRAWAYQYAPPLGYSDRVDELALSYEAGRLAGLAEQL